MKRNIQNNFLKLTALVVTLVVLLILAGITIATLFGENGVINKAQKAKGETEITIQSEQEIMNDVENTLKNANNEKPIIKSINTKIEDGKLKIAVIATDKDDNKLKYQLYTGVSENSLVEYEGEREVEQGKEITWIVSVSNPTQCYYKIDVKDKCLIVSNGVKKVSSTPIIAEVKVEAKTINSIIIKSKASDEENDLLTYTLYIANTKENLTKENAKGYKIVEGVKAGEETSIHIDGLDEYTNYFYCIEVSDGCSTKRGNVMSVKTACSGKVAACIYSECKFKSKFEEDGKCHGRHFSEFPKTISVKSAGTCPYNVGWKCSCGTTNTDRTWYSYDCTCGMKFGSRGWLLKCSKCGGYTAYRLA